MPRDVTNPHDKFFRQALSHQHIAADFLANYLPEDVAEQLNLDSPHLEPVSYVDEQLRDQWSDLLYRVSLTDGGPGFVYVLFEHKSYADPYVALQLLRYMAAIWDQYLTDRKTGRRDRRRLPVIIPLVFYHGAQRWQPRTLGTLLGEVPADLSGYVPDFPFILSDFSAAGSPEFRGQPLLQAILRAFHAVPAGNLRGELERIMLLWNGLTGNPTGLRLFRAMLEYVFRADNTVTVDEVVQAARTHISPREGSEAMTIAEKLRQEGETIGEERGIQKVLQRLLESRFGELPEPYKQRLQQADSNTLLTWSERVLTADTLEDIFGQSYEQ